MKNTFDDIYAAHTELVRHRSIRTLQNQFLLLLFSEGSGYLQHNENIYDFNTHDCILLHDMNELYIVPQTPHSCSFTEISFSQNHVLYQSFQSQSLTMIDAYLNSPADLTLRSLDDNEYKIVSGLYNTCMQLLSDTLPHALLLKQEVISTLLFYLARLHFFSMRKKGQKGRVPAAHTVMIEQIRQYVKQNYSAPLSLSSLADFVYTNPSYLSRVFKAQTGTALAAYINEVRITHARQMLIDTDELIIDIAIACGYNYIPHFNKVFRELTGMTPTAYRKTYKKPSF